MADQVALLKDIAKQFGKSVRVLNLFDPAVCTSPADPDHPWKHLPLPGDFFRNQLSIECNGLKVGFRANSDFMVGQISGNFAMDPCHINRRLRGESLNETPSHISGFPALPVFVCQSSSSFKEFLNSTILGQALDGLQLKEKESLHLYAYGIVLYLQRASASEIMSAIAIACELAKQLPAGNANYEVDLNVLPSKFKGLIPLIRRWGVADDEERSELLEKASPVALGRLVKSVTPHLKSIDEYLDSFGKEALSDAAIALGALAECTLEARIRLGHPNQE